MKPERTPDKCPTEPRFPGDTVGCGSLNTSEPDAEGLCDCLDCGIWFSPEDDQRGPPRLPPDTDDQNDDRAEWARQTLEFFQSLTRTDPGDAVTDLLSNIGHLVDRDPQWAPDGLEVEVWRAASTYEDETRGKGDEEDGKAMGALEATLAHCYETVRDRHVRNYESGSQGADA